MQLLAATFGLGLHLNNTYMSVTFGKQVKKLSPKLFDSTAENKNLLGFIGFYLLNTGYLFL